MGEAKGNEKASNLALEVSKGFPKKHERSGSGIRPGCEREITELQVTESSPLGLNLDCEDVFKDQN